MKPRIFAHLISLFFSLSAVVACTPQSGGEAANQGPPQIFTVNKDNYLSGKAFCDQYSRITAKESGKYVTVPKNYENLAEGELRIYAYSYRPYDPSLPTYLLFDGGPGQNSHGLPDIYRSGFNEIRMDQRGLGCSAPETYEEYKEAALYSTINTVRDADRVRQAFGISAWSVYGVSYGTVAATMYGNLFPKATRSVVLEGTVFSGKTIHLEDYKAEKLNLVLDEIGRSQRIALANLSLSEPQRFREITLVLTNYFYFNNGLQSSKAFLQRLISAEGVFDFTVIDSEKKKFESPEYRVEGNFPQKPLGTDNHVLTVIYCRELGGRQKDENYLGFDPATQMYRRMEASQSRNVWGRECDEHGVSVQDERIYEASQYPLQAPVYYFQGSHDGATSPLGAIQHWRTVPQNRSFFLMSHRGGHNPATVAAISKKSTPAEQEGQQTLFSVAFLGLPLSPETVDRVNSRKRDAKWTFLTDVKASLLPLENEMRGISRWIGP